MTQISALNQANSITCRNRGRVVAIDGEASYTTASTATPVTLATVASGNSAGYGGLITNGSPCQTVLITVTYLSGDDCNACESPDAITTSTVTRRIPPLSSLSIPDGYWSVVTSTVVNSSNVAVVPTSNFLVNLYSDYQINCPTCDFLVP